MCCHRTLLISSVPRVFSICLLEILTLDYGIENTIQDGLPLLTVFFCVECDKDYHNISRSRSLNSYFSLHCCSRSSTTSTVVLLLYNIGLATTTSTDDCMSDGHHLLPSLQGYPSSMQLAILALECDANHATSPQQSRTLVISISLQRPIAPGSALPIHCPSASSIRIGKNNIVLYNNT